MLKRLSQNTWIHILLLIVVSVFTFFPTLEMFFYLDEFGSLYDFTHDNFKGVTGFTMQIFYYLYRLFGINATGYYAAGTLVYAISVVVFYFFVRFLLKNRLMGLIAGLVYATSPIGTNTVFMIWTFICEGGYPLNIALISLLYLMLRNFREGKLVYYLLALLAFLLFLELEPRRAFLFFPIVVIFAYLINIKKFTSNLNILIKEHVLFIARVIPLFVGFVAYYKYNITLLSVLKTGVINPTDSGTYDWQAKIKLATESVSDIQPHITATNILLSGPWIFASEKLKGYVDLADINQIYMLIVVTISLAIVSVILAWKVKREWGAISLFALAWIYVNILGIYIFSSPGVSETAHRTLSLASPGYALFITITAISLYTFLAKRMKKTPQKVNKVFFLAFVVFLVVNSFATRYNFDRFNNLRSKPAYAFFGELKRIYPTLPANSIVYIETPPNAQIKNRLGKIYGGNNYGAGATLAIFYPERTMNELDIVRDFVVVEKFVGGDTAKIDQVFSFFFDEKGLRDITSEVRSRLTKKK